ncbi:hypothetical protein G195_000167 [Phytophthora kernoviae 00238/432]|uniref:NADP-dependent oxidoreductase domain-containing protein n=1 Tax=Phytophthora kernoviae 00238/432 TaxID=1284355 RepID=A0A8J4SI80_9STRA|nr:hypothetical protein G195_000167 [Phytophthora kernoviae 00238/432]
MKKRILGNNGLKTSEVGFGCMGLNYHRGPAKDRREMISVVHSAIDAGITMLDTAEVYGPYTNEELVGEALAGQRSKVQIATKGGFKITGLTNELDSRPESIHLSVEGSLKRLQTDYIDLYYIHRVDPKVPIEEVALTMQQLKKEGKILHWGLSEASAETIRRAHSVEPLTAVENEYSIWWREIESDIFPVLEELGIGLVAYSPQNDNRSELPRFTKEAMEANQVIVDYLNKLAEVKNVTTAQVALAWILAQKPYIVPIPGTTNVNRISENVAARNIVFTEQEMMVINKEIDKIQIVGHRYPEAEKRRTGK